MEGQFGSSGFQLFQQQLQATAAQQGAQPVTPGANAQQVSGYTILPAPGAGQPSLSSQRNQTVHLLQQTTPPPPQAKSTQQQGGVSFQQPAQSQQQQPQQQRMQTAQIQGFPNQQLQYLHAAQQSGQLSAPPFQQYSQPQQPSLGTIQILQPKAQPGSVVGRGFQAGQQTIEGVHVMPQPAAPQPIQTGQSLQGLQGLQGLLSVTPGLQTSPGVQVVQQFPGYPTQVTNAGQPKPNVPAAAFNSMGHPQPLGAGPGTGNTHHTGSLFSNSNQRGGYGQGRFAQNDRDRLERGEFRGRPRQGIKREDRGAFAQRMPVRDPPPRLSREREPFRHDRGNRERHDRGFRDYNRRDKERERKPSPLHHHYDAKKDDVRKDQRRETPSRPLDFARDYKPATPAAPKSPPAADYVVKVPQVPFASHEREYSDIARRYTHLYISPDFTKLTCCWAKTSVNEERFPYGCTLYPLNHPVKFETVQGPLESDLEITLPAAKNNGQGSKRWNAKCTFTSGLDSKLYSDVLKGKFDGGTHLINALKFIVAREEKDKRKSGIMCLGGPYNPAIDGGDPEAEVEGLKRACIRHVKEQTLLDLTPCSLWIRFCDVHYTRKDIDKRNHEEITVIFLVDISAIVPTEDEWPTVWKENTEWKKKTAQADIMEITPVSTQQKQEDAQEEGDNEVGKDDGTETVKEEEQEVVDSGSVTVLKDDETEEVPKEVSMLLKCRSAKNGRIKTMNISLDGLLDYDENDRDEATFELSLLAESFNEMLMRDYGMLILKALMEHQDSIDSATPSSDEKKRVLATALPTDLAEPVVKKPKPAETTESTTTSAPTTEPQSTTMDISTPGATIEDVDMHCEDSPGDVVHVGEIEDQTQESQVAAANPTEAPIAEETTPTTATVVPASTTQEEVSTPMAVDSTETEQKQSASTELIVNEELLFAFRYFDRAGCGYIKCDDLRRMLHNLGCCLAPRVVRELVTGAAAMNKEKHDRVCYRLLTDKEKTIIAES